jgi:hypothetical protein
MMHGGKRPQAMVKAKDVLDRAGLKATHRIAVDTEITVRRPW